MSSDQAGDMFAEACEDADRYRAERDQLAVDLGQARIDRDRWRELALAHEAVAEDLLEDADWAETPRVWAHDVRLRRIELARHGLVTKVGGVQL